MYSLCTVHYLSFLVETDRNIRVRILLKKTDNSSFEGDVCQTQVFVSFGRRRSCIIGRTVKLIIIVKLNNQYRIIQFIGLSHAKLASTDTAQHI